MAGRPLRRARNNGRTRSVLDWWNEEPGNELSEARTSLQRAAWMIMGRLDDLNFGTAQERKLLQERYTSVLSAIDILKDN